MTNLGKLQKNIKILAPVVVLVFIIGLLIIYIFDVGRSVGYSYLGIIPGETSAEKVEKKLGNPIGKQSLSGSDATLLKYDFEGETVKFYIKDGLVVLIKVSGEGISQRETFSSELSIFYAANYRELLIALYLDEGRGRIANESTGFIIEDWYFAPSSAGELKANLVGIESLGSKKPTFRDL